jgi:hypothetical protein
MIEAKLILIAQATLNNPTPNYLKLKAIHETKKLLSQIDLNAEVAPMKSESKLKELFIYLKGNLLTKEESKLAKELAE